MTYKNLLCNSTILNSSNLRQHLATDTCTGRALIAMRRASPQAKHKKTLYTSEALTIEGKDVRGEEDGIKNKRNKIVKMTTNDIYLTFIHFK